MSSFRSQFACFFIVCCPVIPHLESLAFGTSTTHLLFWHGKRLNWIDPIADALQKLFSRKIRRAFYYVPFRHHDQNEIKQVLKEAGFRAIKTETVAKVSAPNLAEDAATGLVQGNPVAGAIAERDPALLPVITRAVAQAIKDKFSESETRAPMRAIVVRGRA